MRKRWGHWRLAVTGAVLLSATWGGVRLEPDLLAEEARGAVEPDGEHRLVIEGMVGQIAVTVSEDGLLKFASSSMPEGGEAPALSLWDEGGTLVLRAPEAHASTPRTVWLALPDGVSLEVAVSDSRVTLGDLRESVEVRGSALDLKVFRIAGDVDATLEGGTAIFQGLDGELSIEAVGSEVTVARSRGSTFATFRDSTAVFLDLSGVLNVESEGGTLEIEAARSGGELRLRETPLTLGEAGGGWRIETNAAVSFEDNPGDLDVESWGGRLEGSVFGGPLSLRLHNATAALSALSSGGGIEADGSDVRLSTVSGDLRIVSVASSVSVVGMAGAVTVEADGGSLTLTDPASSVEVKSQGTEVSIEGAGADLDVAADAPSVDIEWAKLSSTEDSQIVNHGGDVTIRLPGSGGCRLDARSRRGWIEIDHPDIRVSDDGEHAMGIIGRRRRPTLKVDAEGAITILWR